MLIAGNWKLNCNIAQAYELVKSILNYTEKESLNCNIAVFPPFTALTEVNKILKNTHISLGAQDCSAEIKGAYTGDVSAEMLYDIGCKYVIVGHSERRISRGDTNNIVLKKAINAQKNNLIPIICVGEKLMDRDNGKALDVIKQQLEHSLPLECNKFNCIIAYEPIWAIGSGKIPTIEDITQMFSMIKDWLLEKYNDTDIKLLYGGSVNNDNAKEIFSCNSVGGLLIGGVSLKAEEFSEICKSI